ncbi:ribokinase [Olea europaea var. sylvestris]|uniref:Ribokinase-like isoform X1 n=1 Tax=Olea europaea subsp. europaea TaxID=158383 RepID=A0A8S0T528_OLEEU|nr:ribokinase [Olea europaea var. sylvestris]CAA2999511.1 ribokinase-like isoform X1 [Olea europaea subsp. europaea]
MAAFVSHSFPSATLVKSSPSPNHSSSSYRVKMSSSSSPALPPLPENRVVLGCGAVSVDFLAAVASYPKPDDKLRSTSAKIQGGGNAGNALTCAARLGLNPRLISKVADDSQGKGILDELEADGVDSSFIVVSKGGNSPFSYIIVDDETKTRTCIHTPGYPPMIPDDLTNSKLLASLDGAKLVYFDGRLHETALVVAQEATRRGIPILIDAERKREGLDDLLSLSSYAICSAKFPQAWTEAPSVPSALVSMLLKLPSIKFVIVTLGEEGCLMLERCVSENVHSEEVDVDDLLEMLKDKKDNNTTIPICIPSGVAKLHAKGIGTVTGRMLLGTAEKIPPSELVDTTGAGDSFIGAVVYAICANMPPEKMLPFAAQVAAIGCRSLGARTGLPHRSDPRLMPFLQ